MVDTKAPEPRKPLIYNAQNNGEKKAEIHLKCLAYFPI